MFSRRNEQLRHSSLCDYIRKYQSKCEMLQKTPIKMAVLLLLGFIVSGAVCTERLYLEVEDFLGQEND